MSEIYLKIIRKLSENYLKIIQKLSENYLKILQPCPNIINNLSEDCLKIVSCLVSCVSCILSLVSCLVSTPGLLRAFTSQAARPPGAKDLEKRHLKKNPQKQQPVSPKNETVASMRTAAKF